MLARGFDTSIIDLPACLLGLQPHTLPTGKYKSIPGADALVKDQLLPICFLLLWVSPEPWLAGAALSPILQMLLPTLPTLAPCGDTRTRHPPASCPSWSPPCCFSFLWGAVCLCSLLLSWHTSVIFCFVLGEFFYFYPLPSWVWLNNYFILNYLSWSNCMVSTFLTRPQLM